MTDDHAEEEFRHKLSGREPYRFTVDDLHAMQKLGLLSDKGGFELMGGIMLMRSTNVPIRLHSADLPLLYEAGIIPAGVRTEMVEGMIYHVA